MAVTFDSTASSAVTTAGRTFTWSHTQTGGSKNALLVGISWLGNGNTVSSATYGAQNLSKVSSTFVQDTAATHGQGEFWSLLAPSGNQTITVNMNADILEGMAGSVILNGVDQVNTFNVPATTAGNSATASVNVTSAVNEIIVGIVTENAAGTAAITTNVGTERWRQTPIDGIAGLTMLGPTTTLSWTLGNVGDFWCASAVSIKADVSTPSTGAYQQEQNTTDRYLLEDGTGVYLIEPWGQVGTTFFPPRLWGDLDGIGRAFSRDRLN